MIEIAGSQNLIQLDSSPEGAERNEGVKMTNKDDETIEIKIKQPTH